LLGRRKTERQSSTNSIASLWAAAFILSHGAEGNDRSQIIWMDPRPGAMRFTRPFRPIYVLFPTTWSALLWSLGGENRECLFRKSVVSLGFVIGHNNKQLLLKPRIRALLILCSDSSRSKSIGCSRQDWFNPCCPKDDRAGEPNSPVRCKRWWKRLEEQFHLIFEKKNIPCRSNRRPHNSAYSQNQSKPFHLEA
jgi:hypothetical protein